MASGDGLGDGPPRGTAALGQDAGLRRDGEARELLSARMTSWHPPDRPSKSGAATRPGAAHPPPSAHPSRERLERVGTGAPSQSKTTRLGGVASAPARSQSARPRARFSSRRDATASATTWTACPRRASSRAVWKTQTCASMPATTTARGARSRDGPRDGAARRRRRTSSLSMGCTPSARAASRASGATVGPRPFGYCSLATTGTRAGAPPRAGAACSRRAAPSPAWRHRRGEALLNVDDEKEAADRDRVGPSAVLPRPNR